jgi:hypothetical protein
MTRIEDIFLLARDTLNDHKKERWSDATLLRNLKMGMKDIAKQTGLFKDRVIVPLINGTSIYKLPDGILTVSHCTFNQITLPLRSSGWMDKNYHSAWRQDTVELDVAIEQGLLEQAIFDEVKRKQMGVYPRPFGDMIEWYISVPNEYGLVGGIPEYSQPSAYGVIAELVDSDYAEDLQDSAYGVVTAIAEQGSLTVYFTECPPLPDTIDDDMQLDDCWDPALKFYICGIALRNDVDAVNRAMASEEFTLYERELEAIEELANTDSVDAPWFESHYNPMG